MWNDLTYGGFQSLDRNQFLATSPPQEKWEVLLQGPQSALHLSERPCPAMQSVLKLVRSAAFYETMSHLYPWRFLGAWGVPWSAGFTRCAGINNPFLNTECHIQPIANGHKVTNSQKNILGFRWGPVKLMQSQLKFQLDGFSGSWLSNIYIGSWIIKTSLISRH